LARDIEGSAPPDFAPQDGSARVDGGGGFSSARLGVRRPADRGRREKLDRGETVISPGWGCPAPTIQASRWSR